MNATSSRSHAVFTLKCESWSSAGQGWAPSGEEPPALHEAPARGEDAAGRPRPPPTSSALFRLVDLAGSERMGQTGAAGQRLEEAKRINQSLSTLSQCIVALASKRPHVPFRNSKLTTMLSNSLGG